MYKGGVRPLKIYVSQSRKHVPREFILYEMTVWVKGGIPSWCPPMSPLLLIHFRGYVTLGTVTIRKTPYDKPLCLYIFRGYL
jgi:hypothetical protein